jgi:hypothetical protein
MKKMRKLSEIERAYIACAVDTEGTISLLKKQRKMRGMKTSHIHFYPMVKVGNTNMAFLENIERVLGMDEKIYDNGAKWKTHNWKQTRVLVIRGWDDIYSLLEQITLYLIIKKRQSKLLIEACKIHLPDLGRPIPYPERMFEIQREIMKLNIRGKSGVAI